MLNKHWLNGGRKSSGLKSQGHGAGFEPKVTSNHGASLTLKSRVVSYTPPCSRKDSGSNYQESCCTEGMQRQLPACETCSEEASADRVAWKSIPGPVLCPPALVRVGMGMKESGKILRLSKSAP